MEPKSINPNHPQKKPVELGKTTSKMNLGDVFSERKRSYLNEFNLFIAHFNSIPNLINETNIDCKKANKWFVEQYKDEIKNFYFNKIYYNSNKNAEYDDIFYILDEDLLVDFDTNNSVVRFLFRKTDISKVEAIINEIKKFKERKARRKLEISLLVESKFGIGTKSMEILRPKLSIEDNYNDDFREIHQTIIKRLSKKKDKGLVLLHGKPGTGKPGTDGT